MATYQCLPVSLNCWNHWCCSLTSMCTCECLWRVWHAMCWSSPLILHQQAAHWPTMPLLSWAVSYPSSFNLVASKSLIITRTLLCQSAWTMFDLQVLKAFTIIAALILVSVFAQDHSLGCLSHFIHAKSSRCMQFTIACLHTSSHHSCTSTHAPAYAHMP